MQRLGKSESEVVDRTLQKKQWVQSSKLALSWSLVNLLMAVAMYLEMKYKTVGTYFSVDHPLLWYAECILALLFTFNMVVDALRYIAPSLSSTAVELTPKQKKLLGVKDTDVGFKTCRPVRPKPDSSSPLPGPVSPSSFGSYSPGSTNPSPLHYSHGASPAFSHSIGHFTAHSVAHPMSSGGYLTSHSPGYHMTLSGHRTPSPCHLNGGSSSYLGHSGSFLNASYANQSLTQSFGGTSSTSLLASPYAKLSTSSLSSSTTLSPLFRDASDMSGLRSRYQSMSPRNSSLDSSDCISDMNTLGEFLKEQDEKEFRNQLGSAENSPAGGTSFWNFSRTAADYAPILRKYQYQVACRSPQSMKSRNDDPDDPATYRAEEVWASIGVHPDVVDQWIENLRKWLSQTIMNRLVKQIRKINKSLVRLGSEDMQIGEVSIATLKQLAVTKGVQLPSLNAVIPYLDVHANQEYLVKRICDLGGGGCMSDFKWNGGGEYKGKAWGEHLPTDSVIVMHMLCSYMDARLPPHPKYPDGKTFTSEYFLKTPDKPNLQKTDNLCIYQSRINPPHYKVLIQENTWDLPKGRNNMFQAILLFLWHIHSREHGMLGRVNLGMSGINVLWVLECKA